MTTTTYTNKQTNKPVALFTFEKVFHKNDVYNWTFSGKATNVTLPICLPEQLGGDGLIKVWLPNWCINERSGNYINLKLSENLKDFWCYDTEGKKKFTLTLEQLIKGLTDYGF